jgi:hypothetical protein
LGPRVHTVWGYIAWRAVVGVLGSGFAASSAILIDSFKQGMRENGFSEGHDYVLEVRWAEGDSQHNFGALFAAL